jgi:sulfur carrier protein ThiS
LPQIIFNAFSFLQKVLKEKCRPYANVVMTVPEKTVVRELLVMAGLAEEEVEAVFVNGRVCPLHHVIEDGDRIAAVPPGTPGPYRVLLGMKQVSSKQ